MAKHLIILNTALMETAKRPIRLLITMPPRHGKSFLTSQYFPAWFLGIRPERRIILASYEADFASSWGRRSRDVLERFGELFRVRLNASSSAANRWDIADQQGGMVTAGVGGPITGRGADLLIIDDPVKNAEEALSATYREKTWDWYTSTAYTRLEPGASIVLIQTRWHEDDLAGRILRDAEQNGEQWKVLNFPAIATGTDWRAAGDPLWPARYTAEKLEQIRNVIGPRWFACLYQQTPVPMSGGMFRRDALPIMEDYPFVTQAVRFWDLAGTEAKRGKDPDWTAGVKIGKSDEGLYYVLDVVRFRANPHEVQETVKQVAMLDGHEVAIWMEQEPGSAGKALIEHYTRNVLAGWNFHGEAATGEKSIRANPFSSQCDAGNVRLVKGEWNKAYIDELVVFPYGVHDDQVDASSGAFSKVAGVQKRRLAWL